MTNNKNLTSSKGGVWQIMLDLLVDRFGEYVSNEELADATGQHNYARRLRELRAEGWQILYTPSKKGYKLLSLDKIEKNPGEYVNLRLRTEVLERDGYTCQMCGHKGGDKYSDGEIVKLEADHILPLAVGGQTTVDNLQTLCSRCNAGKKAVAAYSIASDEFTILLKLDSITGQKIEQAAADHDLSVKAYLEEQIAQLHSVR